MLAFIALASAAGCSATRPKFSDRLTSVESAANAKHGLPQPNKLPAEHVSHGQEAGVTVDLAAANAISAESKVKLAIGNMSEESAVEAASPVYLGERMESAVRHTTLTLALLEQMALQQNVALRQSASEVNQARGIYEQVGLKPNPTLGYFGQEIGNSGAGGQHGGFLSQTWVRGDKLAWNRRVVAHDVAANQRRVQVQRQRVLTDLRVAYYDTLAAQLRKGLALEFRIVAEEAVRLASEKLEAEVGTRPDVLQSEILLSEIDMIVQQAEFERAAGLQTLAALCGVADLGPVALAGDFDAELLALGNRSIASGVPFDSEAVLAELYATSPELAVAMAQVDRACANLQRQKVQAIPNVTTQLGVGADDATGDAFSNVQVGLPVPLHNQNQGNIRAANASYQAALQNVDRIRMRLRSDLAQALNEYQKAEVAVQNYRDRILPKAKSALELIEKGKEAGEFDFLRVLTARRLFFNSNLQYVSSQARLAQAGARIDGKLLTGGLSQTAGSNVDDGLRGQALSGQ